MGEGPETDGFLAAYSLYLVFVLFGASMRLSMMPMFGATENELAFRERAAEAIGRLAPPVILIAVLLAIASPLLGRALTPNAGETAQNAAVIGTALLAFAALCQTLSAALSAVLAATRRFLGSSLFYTASSAFTLIVAVALMLLLDSAGAGLAVLLGSIAVLGAHAWYLRSMGFHAPPLWRAIGNRATWVVVLGTAGGAAWSMASQVNLSISLAAISGSPGAITGYVYAYFIATVCVSLTAATIGFVSLPGLVNANATGDMAHRAATDYSADMAAIGMMLFTPLAVGYTVFGHPIVESVFGNILEVRTLDLLWDASRLFMLLAVAWVMFTPVIMLAIAARRFSALAIIAGSSVVIHAAAVIPAATAGVMSAAVAHTAAGTAAALVAVGIIFRRKAVSAIWRSVLKSLPVVPLALAFPIVALVVPPDRDLPLSLLGTVLAGLIYVAMAILFWPSVGGRIKMLIKR